MAAATTAPERRPAHAAGSSAPGCWLVLHELQDPSAPLLLAALAAARPDVRVHGLSSTALLAWVRWQSRLDATGASCRLQLAGQPGLDLHAGAAHAHGAASLRLTGVVNRLAPLALPAAAEDAEYKSAEWQALWASFLHGLPCPVLNRPRCTDAMASSRSPARWRQRAAQAGLPIWPLAVAAAPVDAAPALPGLLVVGDEALPALGSRAAAWPPALQHAAVQAVRQAGMDMLAWTGGPDAQGLWRVSGATPWPDLHGFGPEALQAVARWLGRMPARAPSAPRACDATS